VRHVIRLFQSSEQPGKTLVRTTLLLVASLLVMLALPTAGRANEGQGGKKIEQRLADRAAAAPDADTKLHVIVFGDGGRAAAARHGKVEEQLDLVGGVSATLTVEELQGLADEDGVSFVAEDSLMVPNGSDDLYSSLATIYPAADNTAKAWLAGQNGAGVGIAIIDSGVTPAPDFGSRLTQVRLDGQLGSIDDTNGHGSLVAGIAAGSSPDGRFVGIAPGANLYAINVNRSGAVYSSDVIAGLKWVLDNAHAYNIRVVNLSLTETTPSSYKQSSLDLAVERLWASGVVVVTAAGNLGSLPGSVDYAPANDPLALTVGAVDTRDTIGVDDDVTASFSSGGVTLDGFAKPELLAPGRHIASILPAGTTLALQAPLGNWVAPGYASISGTSFSAPQAAAAAAILFQLHPDWSPDAVKGVLVKKAHSLKNTSLRGLDVTNAAGTSSPVLANQGVPALVCAPGSVCLSGSTIASNWNSSSWTASSWTSSSWVASSWNSSSWTSSSWVSSSWVSSSWVSSSWTSGSWD
jgi:serine protease AprX